MSIHIYYPNETDFTHNGLGTILATSASATEELNGMFELELTCSASNAKRTWEYLNEEYIIRADTPRTPQLFRIYYIDKRIDSTIKVHARHLFYDGLYNNMSIASMSTTADQAIKKIFSSTLYPNKFNAGSTVNGSNTIEFRDTNPIAAIMGKDGIIQKYGGELLRDNYNVTLMPNIGIDRGFTVRYRKNLTGMTLNSNIEGVLTRIKPIAQTADSEPLYLPEVFVDSPNIGLYFMPKIGVVRYNDIRAGREGMTAEMAYIEMRNRVRDLFVDNIDLPKVNAKIDFILLSQTENYKEYAHLENIQLGDIVTTIHDGINVHLKAKCIKYTYDCIRNQYNQIELGDFKENIANLVDRAVSTVSGTNTTMTGHLNDMTAHLTQKEHEDLKKVIAKVLV